MGSGKEKNKFKTKSKISVKNPSKKLLKPLHDPTSVSRKKQKEQKALKNKFKEAKGKTEETKTYISNHENNNISEPASASEQLCFFLDQFQSAKGLKLSSLELESIKDTCMLEFSEDVNEDTETLVETMKTAIGPSWKQVLCEGQLVGGEVDPGSPVILIVSSSALRAIELLRGFRSLTKGCRAAKLFSKHMKVEEQVSLLKNRVNIASGTPSRIKKLIEIEALGLSRLQVLLIDYHPDIKGYSMLTLPQVRDEFWDVYKNYFYQRMVVGNLRLCLYGFLKSAVR